MSSTNVHSNIHVCAGQTIPTERGMDVPPANARRGPKKIEVMEGQNAVIAVLDNKVVRDNNRVLGRATNNGQILSGDVQVVKKALDKEMDR